MGSLHKPLVVVHGGAEVQRYRNVLDAMEQALVSNADMFEFDVRRTGDGTLVVHHDADISGRPLAAMTYREAAAAAGALGYTLPLLLDVLSRTRDRIGLDVELKECGHEGALLGCLADERVTLDRVVITSFEQTALDAVHALDRSIRTGLLVYDVTGLQALELFKSSGAAFLGPDHRILDDPTLERARAARIPLLPWTVNDRVEMDRLLRAGLMGVITDRPLDAIRAREQIES
jgi:glycerophosphoryl diester phosphodiesterase